MDFINKTIKWLIFAFVLPLSLTIKATEEFVDPAQYAWLGFNSAVASFMPVENNRFLQNGFLMKNWSSLRISIPGRCAHGLEKDGELCYPKCKEGFYGVGPVCWQACPEGYHDDGMTCRQDRTHAKNSYGRGVGTIPPCHNGKVNDAGLCYPQCKEGYYGVGPVCWQQCEQGLVNTGAICQDPNVHIDSKPSYGRGAGQPIIVTQYEDVYDELACYNDGWTGFASASNLKQSYTVARNEQEKVSVFSFRGTANVENILADVDITPHNLVISGKNVWLHSGFWRNFNSISDEIKQALEQTPSDHKIIVTGHSLGGAVANIAAAYFAQWGYKPDSVFLFGSPLPGDSRFREVYRDLVGCNRTLRISTTGDIIPDVPAAYSYTHVCDSTEVNYDKDILSNHDPFLGYAYLMKTMFNPDTTHSTKACAVESVILFDEKNHQGDKFVAAKNSLDLGSFNKKMSSFIIPPSWKVRFYEQPQFQGGFYTRTVSENYATDFNDKIQSVEILERPDVLVLFDGDLEGEAKYVDESSADLGDFKNKMSSFSIPKGWKVRFYDRPNYQGNYYTRSEGEESATGFDDSIQSVKIMTKNNTIITLYAGINQTGTSLNISENTPDLGSFNNQMSSFAIPANWTVRFYEGLNYQGEYYTREGGMQNATELNKKIKSIQILTKN